MNGEKLYIQKYAEYFINKISLYEDVYFEKDKIYESDGKRGSWVPNIENLCFTLVKAKRNNELEKVQIILNRLLSLGIIIKKNSLGVKI